MCVWITETQKGALLLLGYTGVGLGLLHYWTLVSWHVMCFQGERYWDLVCGADSILPLPERRMARHSQGSLLLL